MLQQQTVDAAGSLLVASVSDREPHVFEMLSRARKCATDMARLSTSTPLSHSFSPSEHATQDGAQGTRGTTNGRRSAPTNPGPARVTPADEAPARSLAFVANSKRERVRRAPVAPKAVRRANSAECVAVILDT